MAKRKRNSRSPRGGEGKSKKDSAESGRIADSKEGRASLPHGRGSDRAGVHPGLLIAGAVALLVAAGGSLMLALGPLGGQVPGCGEGSACAEAAASVWGKVPVLNWPVSLLGLAYYAALLVVWLATRGRLPALMQWLVRLGVLVSVMFTIVMFVEQHLCQYCLASHAGNLAFWGIMEGTRRRGAPRPAAAPAFAGFVACFVLLIIPLIMLERAAERRIAAEAEGQLQQSIEQMVTAAGGGEIAPPSANNSGGATPATQQAVAGGESTAAGTESASATQTAEATTASNTAGFRGRYLYGPEEAAARIVMFTDYQCKDCRRVEGEIQELLANHDSVSLSVKLFPFSTQCNPTVNRDLHPNACWAARAAEAAGILYGNEGFWNIHSWLFEHGGLFQTQEELNNAVREIGYDPAGFVQVMMSQETLDRVQADIQEARQVGLWQTPMIFINGVELRGWYARNAVVRAVEAVLAANPAPKTHAGDAPPGAIEKCVGDWREQVQRPMPPDTTRWPLGIEDAAVQIVVFGDYQEPNLQTVDRIVREWMAGRADAQFVVRHYPLNPECNPAITEAFFENSCWGARAVEAAGQIGGVAGYWRMHDWLLSHQGELNDAALRAAAPELGFDNADALLAAMQHETVQTAIREDVQAGQRMGVRGVPAIYVNGRWISRWGHLGPETGERILKAIFSAAAESR